MNYSADAGRPAVAVDGLRVVRGNRLVLDDLSCSVPPGQLTGLIGPSGGGKTTLIRSIVGVQIVAGGSITVLGEPAGSPSLRRRVAYATQDASVYGDLTVRENLAYFGKVLAAPAADVERVVAQVDLGSHIDAMVDNLSGGQRARVSLAVALLGAPEVIVLDEPTVGLDPVLRRDLWELFHRIAEGGTTLLVSSHVMDEAERCQRLLLLREGRILADDTPQHLLEVTGTANVEAAFLHLVDAANARQAGATGEALSKGASR